MPRRSTINGRRSSARLQSCRESRAESEAFDLGSLLRHRAKLPWPEIALLCRNLAAQLESRELKRLPVPSPLLPALAVKFTDGDDGTHWRRVPVSAWPEHELTLLVPELDDADHTRLEAGDPTLATEKRMPPAAALAALVYELLEGTPPRTPVRPLRAAWNEAASNLLLQALEGVGETNPAAFWAALSQAAGTAGHGAARAVRSPRLLAAMGSPEEAALLHLVPLSRRVVPIEISARSWLRIGRSAEEADVLARFTPETAENVKLTRRLGRVHALARRVDGWPCFWDGDGGQPSVNGSWLDEERLHEEAGKCARPSSILRLGTQFSIRVACLEHSVASLGPAQPTIGEAEAAERSCTVLFLPQEHPPPRLTAWLGSSVALDVSENGLEWTEFASGREELAVLRSRDGFWLANLALPRTTVLVDGVSPPAGTAVSLRDGQAVKIGQLAYSVKTER